MTVAALVLYVAWMLAAFGARTLMHRRQTGDSGWRGLRGSPGSPSWFAGMLFALALAVGFAAPVVELARSSPSCGSTAAPWIGVAVAVMGIAFTVLAQSAMRDSWRIGVDPDEVTTLRTDGLFAVVRNPIFTAMVITAAGLGLMVANAIALIGVVALLVAVQLQVRVVEEPHLRAVHGDRYAEYTRRVGRFVPRVGLRG